MSHDTTGDEEECADAIRVAATVEGWLTDAQAALLWEAAHRVRTGGSIVEIGSFRGRSTIVLARAAGPAVAVTAIDPHAGSDRGPGEIAPDAGRGQGDIAAFRANLAAAGVTDRVRHIRKESAAALGEVDGEIDLLFIDGAHRYRPARDDIAHWAARVGPGGTLLIHDAFNAIGVTAAQTRLLVFGSAFRYIGRTGSLAEYRREPLVGAAARGRNAGRQLVEAGYFARMLLVKGALTVGAYPLARAAGHRSRDWPY
jgi:predicted O-methyltransferase YrrM